MKRLGLTGLILASAGLCAAALAQPPALRTTLRSSVPSGGWARTPQIHPVTVEGGEHLGHFYGALRALRRDRDQRVRVLHYGDSNVAADLWTMITREALQRRFGDGGAGYFLPRGHGSWHRVDVHVRSEGSWESRRRGFGRDYGPADGLWGLAGVAVEPGAAGARVRVDVPAGPDDRRFELHLLGRPRPRGRVAVRIDDGEWETIDLWHDEPTLILRRWPLDGAEHEVQVRHAGGIPRVLGMVVENDAGVVYDVLGINGHRASAINHWDEDLLRSQLSLRRPDLVVLSYGGNEALDPNLPMDAYERQTRAAVARIREAAPGASCLMVGPVASMPRYADRMGAVTEIQRRIAPDLGCAFWDASRPAGGHGRLRRWLRFPGMVSGDHLHLGRQGYELVGREFAASLLRGL
ncbi:MAG TPA: GDSL-type esterase/lipase family protein [Sandaracinaceae bacterium LLY-WYZ-13_1]|nr:GDSL-type esterase/lipase family protein [Sandaracinaceae bacterium LLY-WYZ-13_1]